MVMFQAKAITFLDKYRIVQPNFSHCCLVKVANPDDALLQLIYRFEYVIHMQDSITVNT